MDPFIRGNGHFSERHTKYGNPDFARGRMADR
jgi:hypothetical protein